jgi:hypothetical protein
MSTTFADWFHTYTDLDQNFAFSILAGFWHGGQWSGLYKLSCNGRILDAAHASDIAAECRSILRKINDTHEDYVALCELEAICDLYPNEGQDDEDS